MRDMNSAYHDAAYYGNVSVQVRAEVDEMAGQEVEDSALYDGIYHVRLNRTVEIAFVPVFQRNDTDWPPILPPLYSNTFPVETVEQARSSTAALADYTVTVRCHEKEQTEPFVLAGFNDVPPHHGVLFLISKQEFELFERELSELAYATSGRTAGLDLSDVQQNKVIQFLLSRVICSPCFRNKDARTLESGSLLMK